MILTLPMPPSLNNIFATGANGGRFRSKEYESWRKEAGWELRRQKPDAFTAQVSIAISMQEPRRPADADNRIKAVLDLLVLHGVIPTDDSRCVRKVSAEWSAEVTGARVEISHASPSPTPRRGK